MLLNSLIIILREVLEASLLVSMLLLIANPLQLGYRWLWGSALAGVVAAGVYAANLGAVSSWFDYVGQEVVNALLQLLIYLAVLLILVLLNHLRMSNENRKKKLALLMALTLVAAVCREGSEIIIYLSGFLHSPDLLAPVMTGGLIGAAIGASAGALFYYAIFSLAPTRVTIIGSLSLALVASGIFSQAIQLLIQADWISNTTQLWDSSSLLSEKSITGQLLYAVAGYESRPAIIQVVLYFLTLALSLAVILTGYKNRSETNAS